MRFLIKKFLAVQSKGKRRELCDVLEYISPNLLEHIPVHIVSVQDYFYPSKAFVVPPQRVLLTTDRLFIFLLRLISG